MNPIPSDLELLRSRRGRSPRDASRAAVLAPGPPP
jgi:hypothetical protein